MKLDRDTSDELVQELCEIQARIHQPVREGLPDMSPSDLERLKRMMGLVIGSIYTDLMIPVIERFPEIDPDSGTTESVSPAGRVGDPSVPSRSEFFRKLVAQCSWAQERLSNLEEVIRRRAGSAEAEQFVEHAREATSHVEALIDFARSRCPQENGKP